MAVPSIIVLLATGLQAQQPQQSTCFPACRAGYVCNQGQCISACNPPCAANQTCTAAGECVDKAAGTGTTAPPTTATAPPPATTSAPPPATTSTGESSWGTPPTQQPSSTAPATEPSPPAPLGAASTSTSTSSDTGTPSSIGGVHTHDGFYFRGGLGAAIFAGATVTPPGATQDVSVTGPGVAVELAFGGTLTNPGGLTLGGGIWGASIPSPSYSANNVSLDGGAAIVSSIGPFADYYFDPTKGLHAQVALGLGVVSAAKGNPTTVGGTTYTFPPADQSGNGFMGMAGLGYEWWVGDQLSLGLLARVQYVSASVKASGDTTSSDVKIVLPALLGTLTYQ